MMGEAPFKEKISDVNGLFSRSWVAWLQKLGTEASRDSGTANPTTALYVGRQFYRTDLNKPVWCSSASGVWRDAAANIVA